MAQKKQFKELRSAAIELIKNGANLQEEFTYIDKFKIFKGIRQVNHYRRMKRIMRKMKITPQAAINIYKGITNL